MVTKTKIIKVQDIEISVIVINDIDYISITDIAKSQDVESRAADVIKNWIRNRSTLEFLGTWSKIASSILEVPIWHFHLWRG